MRGWVRIALGVAALAVVLVGYRALDRAAPAAVPAAKPPRLVSVATAATQDMPVYVRGLGTVDPFNSVAIKSRVDGQIMAIRFEEGQTVKPGDVLFEIDPRPYAALVAQAEAALAKDKAQLANAEADLQRFQSLSVKEYATRQSVDTQKALVAQVTAQLASDQAQIDATKLQLGYATIRAPIGGRVGRRLVDLGNFILASESKPLITLTQIQPIAVTLNVPQDMLPAVQARMAVASLPVEARSPDDQSLLATGKLALIGDAIDKTSGTIPLKSVFDNADLKLWPGQFVNARLVLNALPNAVVVPEAALLLGPDGLIAYIVKPDSTVSLRRVEAGVKAHGLIVVTKGIAAGETVVVDGQDGIAEGSAVTIGATRTQAGGA
jgi:membrane fusion protein, multidrug efflux system